MIWTLKVTCVWGRYFTKDCVRVLEIDARDSLYDLHEAIQTVVDFDRDHPFEFIAGRHRRNRKIVFASNCDSWEHAAQLYSDLTLEQIYPLPDSLRLFYHFDFGDDWYFDIRKLRKRPFEPEPGVNYPRVIESVGPNPEQYPQTDWD